MFRRSFLSSLGVLPFFGLVAPKKSKVQIIELKNRTLFIDTEKNYIFKEIIFKSNKEYFYYYNEEGQIHRDDGPAMGCSDGYKSYWKNGYLLDGTTIQKILFFALII